MGKVDADESQQEEQVAESNLGNLPSKIDDSDRPIEIFAVNISCEKCSQGQKDAASPDPRLSSALDHSVTDSELLGELIRCHGDAERLAESDRCQFYLVGRP